MSTPAPAAAISDKPWFCPTKWLLPHLTPYHIMVAVVLGAITAGFGALVAILLIISSNFSAIGWIE